MSWLLCISLFYIVSRYGIVAAKKEELRIGVILIYISYFQFIECCSFWFSLSSNYIDSHGT